MTDYEPIQNDSRDGDFVLTSQQTGKDEGFRNVSKLWLDKTIPIATEIERREQTRDERESFTAKYSAMRPLIWDDLFALEVRVHGQKHILFPDEYALKQLGNQIGIGSDFPVRILSVANGHQSLLYVAEHVWHELPDNLGALLRVDGGNQLRAVLPERHSHFRNIWYLRLLERHVPGGRLSHWRGTDYTIYGNLLVPDTIRAEADSDYGAMVSLATSEIGQRGFRQTPSLFRAICMNGCIWGQKKGQALTVNRRSTITTAELERAICENIDAQIGIAKGALDRFLATRSFTTNTSMKPVFAQVAKQYKLKKELASQVLSAWWAEKEQTPDLANTLFAIVNSVTRAGQTQPNDLWVRFDELGGTLARMKRDQWDTLVSQARALRAEEVDRAFARWSISA